MNRPRRFLVRMIVFLVLAVAIVAVLSGQLIDAFSANPPLNDAREIFWGLRGLQFVAAHAARLRDTPDRLGANVRSNTQAGLNMGVEEIARAHRGWNVLFQRFAEYFN